MLLPRQTGGWGARVEWAELPDSGRGAGTPGTLAMGATVDAFKGFGRSPDS